VVSAVSAARAVSAVSAVAVGAVLMRCGHAVHPLSMHLAGEADRAADALGQELVVAGHRGCLVPDPATEVQRGVATLAGPTGTGGEHSPGGGPELGGDHLTSGS